MAVQIIIKREISPAWRRITHLQWRLFDRNLKRFADLQFPLATLYSAVVEWFLHLRRANVNKYRCYYLLLLPVCSDVNWHGFLCGYALLIRSSRSVLQPSLVIGYFLAITVAATEVAQSHFEWRQVWFLIMVLQMQKWRRWCRKNLLRFIHKWCLYMLSIVIALHYLYVEAQS